MSSDFAVHGRTGLAELLAGDVLLPCADDPDRVEDCVADGADVAGASGLADPDGGCDDDAAAAPLSAAALPPPPPTALIVSSTSTSRATNDAANTRRRRQYTDGGCVPTG